MTLPKVTEKQKEIIDLVFFHRFINRHQLQKVFAHKDSKRINVWLKDLVSKNYLGRIYSKKLFENTKPAVYFLSLNGIRYLRAEKLRRRQKSSILRNLYFEKKKSEIFRNHSLYISELYASLAKDNFYIERSEGEKFKFYTFTFHTKQRLLVRQVFKDGYRDIIPDVYLKVPDILAKSKKVKKPNQDSDKDNRRYFLYLFDYHVPQYSLKYRVDQITRLHDYDFNDLKQQLNMGDFPTILFVFMNPKRIRNIRAYIHHRLEMEGDLGNISFLITTSEELEQKGFEDPTIWRTIRTEGDWG